MIGTIGGTGPQGKGLALRLAIAGIDVVLGSRSADRASEAAAEVTASADGASGTVRGMVNTDLVTACEMLVVALPFDGLADTLAPLGDVVDGTVVVSAVNRLGFSGGNPQPVPVSEGSSAEAIAALLPAARVTTAFNNVSAVHLIDPDHVFDEDVLVCGDDADAVARTAEVVDRLDGLRGIVAGPLAHAATIEGITAVLLSVNKAHKVTSGLRVTGL